MEEYGEQYSRFKLVQLRIKCLSNIMEEYGEQYSRFKLVQRRIKCRSSEDKNKTYVSQQLDFARKPAKGELGIFHDF